MLSDQEREGVVLGMEALDAALVGLGCLPVDHNSDFRVGDPVVGELPNVVLEKPSCAPLRFVFGLDLDIWVGGFSEVLGFAISAATKDQVQQTLSDVLRSEVIYRTRRWWVEITLQLPGSEPWRRLKVSGADPTALQPYYEPYAQLR